MALKNVSSVVVDIKKLLGSEKMIIGTRQAIKNLKRGELVTLYISSNCPEEIRADIEYYSSLTETEIIELEQANDELGAICKKAFSISVIGVLK